MTFLAVEKMNRLLLTTEIEPGLTLKRYGTYQSLLFQKGKASVHA